MRKKIKYLSNLSKIATHNYLEHVIKLQAMQIRGCIEQIRINVLILDGASIEVNPDLSELKEISLWLDQQAQEQLNLANNYRDILDE